MADLSIFRVIHSALSAAWGRRQDLLDEEKHAAEEEFLALKAGARTLSQICDATGLSIDQVMQALKEQEGEVMHRVVGSGDQARKDIVMYGLKEHMDGQPEWEPGVDF